jgi:hypothetical protein
VRSPSPPHLPHRPMLVDFVGLCFNCLWLNHVTAVCRHVQETSLNGRGWPPPCQQNPMSSIVINPVARDVALASPPHGCRTTRGLRLCLIVMGFPAPRWALACLRTWTKARRRRAPHRLTRTCWVRRAADHASRLGSSRAPPPSTS